MCTWGVPGSIVIGLIIAITGCLGGIRNWIAEDLEKTPQILHLLKRLIDGMIASASVPLFLSIIGNEKVAPAFGKVRPWEREYQISIFILIGFCSIAAFLSQRFIDSLSRRVMALSDEMKDVKAKVEQSAEITNLQIESEALKTRNGNEDIPNLSDNEKRLLKSLTSGQFLVRSISGLASETKIPLTDLPDVLRNLERLELARHVETSKGERWSATESGRVIAAKARNG